MATTETLLKTKAACMTTDGRIVAGNDNDTIRDQLVRSAQNISARLETQSKGINVALDPRKDVEALRMIRELIG